MNVCMLAKRFIIFLIQCLLHLVIHKRKRLYGGNSAKIHQIFDIFHLFFQLLNAFGCLTKHIYSQADREVLSLRLSSAI